MLQKIPVMAGVNQEFQITLDVKGVKIPLGFSLFWNKVAGYWVLTLKDLAEGAILLDSIPLVTGSGVTANILRKYGYLDKGACYLLAMVLNPSTDYPKESTLGIEYDLIWDDGE